MFRRYKEHQKRKSFLPFVIFRTLLSLMMFLVLIGGIVAAVEHFSGLNLLKGSPQAIVGNFLASPVNEILKKVPASFGLINFLNSKGVDVNNPISISPVDSIPKKQEVASLKVLLVSDSHNENDNLRKAISQVKGQGVELILGLGDYTETGTVEELNKAKLEFDQSGIRYFVTAGDHDLWDARDKQKDAANNFIKVFGFPYQAFEYRGVRFLIVYNSDNYLGLGKDQLSWLNLELERAKQSPKLTFVFMHEPLYHPSSDRIMGKTETGLKKEAGDLIKLFKNIGVSEVFYGDIHFFTQYVEPQTGLKMTTIGSLASLRNVQAPRYALISVFEDGGYEVEDIEVN